MVFNWDLIQRGGGNGPEKPRQPPLRRMVPIPTEASMETFWEMSDKCALSPASSLRRGRFCRLGNNVYLPGPQTTVFGKGRLSRGRRFGASRIKVSRGVAGATRVDRGANCGALASDGASAIGLMLVPCASSKRQRYPGGVAQLSFRPEDSTPSQNDASP